MKTHRPVPSIGVPCKPAGMAYTSSVAETTVTGFGDLTILADNRRSAVFLRPHAFARPYDQWAGLGGETFGSAGSSIPVRQPRSVPAHPIWRWEAGSNSILEAAMRQHPHAQTPGITYRSQTQNSLRTLAIISDALRAAALAQSDRAALDVTGDALRRLTDLAPVSVAWLVVDDLEQFGPFAEHEEASRFAESLEQEEVRIVRVLIDVAEDRA